MKILFQGWKILNNGLNFIVYAENQNLVLITPPVMTKYKITVWSQKRILKTTNKTNENKMPD